MSPAFGDMGYLPGSSPERCSRDPPGAGCRVPHVSCFWRHGIPPRFVSRKMLPRPAGCRVPGAPCLLLLETWDISPVRSPERCSRDPQPNNLPFQPGCPMSSAFGDMGYLPGSFSGKMLPRPAGRRVPHVSCFWRHGIPLRFVLRKDAPATRNPIIYRSSSPGTIPPCNVNCAPTLPTSTAFRPSPILCRR